MYSHYLHAEHNEKVSRYLGKSEKYSDWVIITAFYSALHFVRHLMLAQAVDKKDTFEDLFRKDKTEEMGRHGYQIDFVQRRHFEISKAYTLLSDMAVQARYSRFEYNRNEALAAKQSLDTIKQYVQQQAPTAIEG